MTPAFRAPVTRPTLERPGGGTPLRVLVVDDEPSLTDLLAMALRYEGLEVKTAADGQSALRSAREFRPDIVILDIMLPDLDGLKVLARMRASDPDLPVLFLTAKDALDDRIAGLTAGGDDYVTKPFSLEEVIARVRGVLRRSLAVAPTGSGPVLRVGYLTLNEDSHEAERAGEPIELTATEFELLRYLMRNPRRIVSRMQILDHVWNYDFAGTPSVVEIYISYLRKKIDAGRAPMIHTARGAGYLIRPAVSAP